MKKQIILFSLLVLSGCYGTSEKDAPTTQKITPTPAIETKPGEQKPTSAVTPITPTATINTTVAQNGTGIAANETKSNETKLPSSTEANTSNSTEKATSPAPIDDKAKAPEATTPKANNGTVPHEDKSLAPKNETKSTEMPPSHDAVKPTVQARAFDGPSFIGGIILTLGILAIGFMGFKYYRNQTERNYHTL